jgi:uncharacterized protein (TIGR02284 family)
MSTSPIHQPDYKTIIRALNACIETCMDGEKGYAIAAAEVRSPTLKDMFVRRSTQRSEFMVALQRAVEGSGSVPENEGTARGILHRGWMTAVRIARGRSDALYLEECIRGERAAMHDYAAALRGAHVETLPSDLSRLLTGQYGVIRESLAELIRMTSDYRAKASYEIRTMDTQGQTVVTMRTNTTRADFPRVMRATLETIARDVHEVGVPFAIYHNTFRPDDMDVEIGVVVSSNVSFAKTDEISRRELPPETIAYTLHVGPYEGIGAAYEALSAWIRQNERTPVGPPREIYLVGSNEAKRAQDYRTEIEIPIQ